MKKTALFLLALATGAILHAQEAAQGKYSITMDFPYVSKYTFRGHQITQGAIQPSLEIAAGDAYIGLWSNQPVTKNEDNEFDFYTGYKFKLNDQWSLDSGITLYYYPELDHSSGLHNTTTEAYVGINGDIAGVKPGLYAYYDFVLKNWVTQAQIGYSYPLKDIGVSLDFTGNVGQVIADRNVADNAYSHIDQFGNEQTHWGSDYTYWSLGVQANYNLSEKATSYVGVTYTSHNRHYEEKNFWVFTGGLTVGF